MKYTQAQVPACKATRQTCASGGIAGNFVANYSQNAHTKKIFRLFGGQSDKTVVIPNPGGGFAAWEAVIRIYTERGRSAHSEFYFRLSALPD